MSIEGQGHFFTIFLQVLYVLCFTRPIYQVSVYRTIGPLVSSPELKAHKVSLKDRRPSVCVSVCVSTLSNMNIFEISGPIAIKFYLKHQWGG